MNIPIYLIGFMGSGKTTLAKKLAKKLNREFVDLDHMMEKDTGMSIPEYFDKYGESKFRELEKETLLNSFKSPNSIIATGGGTPCFFDNMDQMLENGLVIYLNLSAKALHTRLIQTNIRERPALQGLSGNELLKFIEKKLEERRAYYERAHHHINPLENPIDSIVMLSQRKNTV